ncbi:ECF-type sigma factor [Ahniella affigens]|nr:ECF-type sigma factor [Ahniella affigens]
MQDFDAIYQHVKRLARHELSKHAPMTLNTTALVHEAYVKLSEYGATVEDRQHLVNLVVRAMRQILIDSARRRASSKHGGDIAFQALEPSIPEPTAEFDAEAVTQAIDQIKQAHPRMGQVVEMHFLGGIEFNDIAELLGVDRKTIYRDWTAARVLLTAELAP